MPKASEYSFAFFIFAKKRNMYRDIITYELAEGVSEEQLLEVAKTVIESWMKNLKGFEKWEIHKNKEGSYTDIVYWASEEDAKEAEKEMMSIPNAVEWFACYKPETISSKNIRLLKSF